MEIEKTSTGNNFSLFGFNLNFFRNTNTLTEYNNKKINDLIKISENIYHLPNIIIKTEYKVNPRYLPSEKKIFIPLDYNNNNLNFNHFKKILGDKFDEIVIFHEIGHAVEYDRNNNSNLIKINNYPQLNYLINGSSVTNNINYFLISNYKEGFADCYSGLCYYIKYDDISIFDKIYQARQLKYQEMKKNNGINYVDPNFNLESVLIFKNIIIDLINNGIDIKKLPFSSDNDLNIEKFIEESTIKGLLKSVVKELEINDTFLSNFKHIGKEFVTEDKGKFKLNIYSEVLKDYSSINKKNMSNLIETLNEQAILPYFIEFQKRSNQIISNEFIFHLIDNSKFNRTVSPNLQITDVRSFHLDFQKDNNFNINSSEKIKLSIKNIRNQSLKNDNKFNLIP